MSSTILGRLISHTIAPAQYCRPLIGQARKLSSGGGASWTAAAAPWLMLPPRIGGGGGGGEGEMVYKFYSLSKRGVVSLNNRGGREEAELMRDPSTNLVGSSHGWVALYNHRDKRFFLSNPLSGRRIKLPPSPALGYDARYYNLHPTKVVLSCSPVDDQQECRAMMISGYGNGLSCCCPGRSSEWAPVSDEQGYEDLVYLPARKRFMCLSGCEEDLECWNVLEPSSPTMDWKRRRALHYEVELADNDECGWYQSFRHLVFSEHLDRLYLVTSYMNARAIPGSQDCDRKYCFHKTVEFCVHNINNGQSCYMDEGLDGLAMFVGINHSSALPATADFPELQPDSIYYTDHVYYWPLEVCGGHDLGIFYYRNKTFSPCSYYPCDIPSLKTILPSPIWYNYAPTI